MSTKMKCPGKVVNGKCIGNDGKEITAPYVSEKGALYPDQKSLVSGCAENPTSSKCQKVISGMTPEQRAKIKGIQRVGGSTKATYKTGGMVNANAKLVATKSAGSTGVKSGVNPKAAASSTAKKPSAARSKAPKKAMPKAKYGMTMKKSC
jgi:hypothetical protein